MKQKDRIIWIDFMVDQNGSIGRIDLKKRFGLCDPAASLSISKYIKLAPKNLKYDFKSKRHVKTKAFKPVYHVSGIRLAEHLQTLVNDCETGYISEIEPIDGAIAVILRVKN